MKKTSSVRLPLHVNPERYQIMIRPDLETFTFTGEETIYFSLTKSTNEITLHAKDLRISAAEVEARHKSGKDIWAAKIKYQPKDERVTFVFPKKIGPGKHRLKLSFNGILADQLKGFYRSRYEHEGKEKFLAATQFEATDARQAFPCFDEPAQKAIFDVTMVIPQHLTAVSNTIEDQVIHHDNGFKVVKFAPTPKMSTYLLAFIVGELEYIEGITKGGVVVRVFTTPGKKEQGKFSLNVAIKTLEFFNKYFNIPYPLPILDMIAIPDFAAAAMENWGAITYRETALLVDEKNTPLINRQHIAHTIAHELAHQWFGNLVTMEWWTHLWLNESFATYISSVAIDHIFPQWHIWSQFVHDDMGWAFGVDGLMTTHPIEVEVHHPDQIDEIFDGISYAKGASVIRMLADYLGERDFRNGLRYYLKKHSYKNTSTVHLWEAFERISKKPVRQMMRAWTTKSGHPLISATLKNNRLYLKQQRFFSSPLSKKAARDSTVWPIPIRAHSLSNKRDSYWYHNKKELVFPAPKHGLKLNSGEVGFFRTAYDTGLLQSLTDAVKNKSISQDDRLGLIRDAFALAITGDLPIPNLFSLLKQYRTETAYNVWVEITAGLGELDVLLANEKAQPQFRKFCLWLLEPALKAAGWQAKAKESDNITLLRSLILGTAGYFGHTGTISKAKSLFQRSVKGKAVHPDIRAISYYLTASNGSVRQFNTMLKLYRKAQAQEEKNRLARALLLFPQVSLIKKALTFTFSKEVRDQDAPLSYVFAWRNQNAWPHLWKYLQTHWAMMLKRYGQGGRFLGYMVKPLAHLSDPRMAQEIKQFLKSHPVPSGELAVAQTIEKLEAGTYRKQRDLKQLIAYLVSFTV